MRNRIFYFVICLIAISCQEKKPELEFKHVKEATVYNCGTLDTKIFEEALLEFEANIGNNYTRKNASLSYSYGQFVKLSNINKANYNELASEHALAVFNALQQDKGLWIETENGFSYNYDHPIFKCIADNTNDKDLSTTFNALLSTNSMNIRMLKDVLLSKSRQLNSDKYLALYVALEMYYANIKDVDISLIKDETEQIELSE